jgi:hypothetical protein
MIHICNIRNNQYDFGDAFDISKNILKLIITKNKFKNKNKIIPFYIDRINNELQHYAIVIDTENIILTVIELEIENNNLLFNSESPKIIHKEYFILDYFQNNELSKYLDILFDTFQELVSFQISAH